jgi:hypothetical protein
MNEQKREWSVLTDTKIDLEYQKGVFRKVIQYVNRFKGCPSTWAAEQMIEAYCYAKIKEIDGEIEIAEQLFARIEKRVKETEDALLRVYSESLRLSEKKTGEFKVISGVRNIAERLGVSTATVMKISKSPQSPFARLGKRIVVSEDILMEWLLKGGMEQATLKISRQGNKTKGKVEK